MVASRACGCWITGAERIWRGSVCSGARIRSAFIRTIAGPALPAVIDSFAPPHNLNVGREAVSRARPRFRCSLYEDVVRTSVTHETVNPETSLKIAPCEEYVKKSGICSVRQRNVNSQVRQLEST